MGIILFPKQICFDFKRWDGYLQVRCCKGMVCSQYYMINLPNDGVAVPI